jgi:hypothetical protein
MRIFLSLFLTSLLLFSPTAAKVKKVAFDAQAAWRYIKDLTSDSMQGRKSGQPVERNTSLPSLKSGV